MYPSLDYPSLDQQPPAAPDTRGSSRLIMLFDLSLNGHHPTYIQHLIQFWGQQQLSGCLAIVVASQFCQHHREVVDFAAQYTHSQICFLPISAAEEATLKPRHSGISRTRRAFQEWELFCNYARRLQPSHGLLLYFDTCLLPLVCSQHPPCPISGIYFRPSFHYSRFVGYHRSQANHWQSWREQLLLRCALKNRQLHTLFCLDPFAVEELSQLAPSQLANSTQVVALADPVRQTHVPMEQVQRLQQQHQIQPGRRVLLLFGALNGRKGVYELLTAIRLLPPAIGRELCLLLVGQANPQEQARLAAIVEQLQQTSLCQVIYHPGFLPESEVAVLFQAADIILAPYQHHVGMSGILLQAAAAGKPVLSSDFGLMGELVRRYRLGWTVDSREPAAIAQSLERCVAEEIYTDCDRTLMQDFVEQNSPERFASRLLDTICTVEN